MCRSRTAIPPALTLWSNVSMNIYLQQVVALSLPNKYTKWYCDLINRAISRNATKDIARHHILPRSFKLGGEKDKINIDKSEGNMFHRMRHKYNNDVLNIFEQASLAIQQIEDEEKEAKEAAKEAKAAERESKKNN